jgi:hypothetical protein
LRNRPWVYVNATKEDHVHFKCVKEEEKEKEVTIFISKGTAELKVEDLTPECSYIRVTAEYLSFKNSEQIRRNGHQNSDRHLTIAAEKTK